MALTDLQRSVMHCLSKNRSETSYAAGGAVLNREWPRLSDDIDLFHDTDEQIVEAADQDIAQLRAAGFLVTVDVRIYGCVEVRVRRNETSETLVQWMSETKRRFFPIVKDAEWGARLHQVDLAINKVLAASSRTKARDYVDLVSISQRMCPLGPLLMAAAGKPPYFSPRRIVDEIRRRSLSIPDEDFLAVKGMPKKFSPSAQREGLLEALDSAEGYINRAPPESVGLVAVGKDEKPVEVQDLSNASLILRGPTEEPEAMPQFADASFDWGADSR
jgi:hypothetical protein